MGDCVGLLAGAGRLPLEMARSLRARGERVAAVGIRGLADPALAELASTHRTLALGQLGALIETWREAGAERVALSGKVEKMLLAGDPAALELDARALALLAGLANRADDSILGALADALQAEGFRLIPQLALVPDLVAPAGPLGRVTPTFEQWQEVAFGFPIARALGELDVGQTVVVRDRAVLALEAIEGTDAAIRRGCALGRPGACIVKVAKPRQDPRFDVPTVGPETLAVALEGGAALLAFEAGASIVLDRTQLVERADAAGVALLGVDEKLLEARREGREPT